LAAHLQFFLGAYFLLLMLDAIDLLVPVCVSHRVDKTKVNNKSCVLQFKHVNHLAHSINSTHSTFP